MFEKLRRAVTAQIPGTTLNIAQQKRRMEKELQAQQGLSRSHAQSIVSERFGKAIKID